MQSMWKKNVQDSLAPAYCGRQKVVRKTIELDAARSAYSGHLLGQNRRDGGVENQQKIVYTLSKVYVNTINLFQNSFPVT